MTADAAPTAPGVREEPGGGLRVWSLRAHLSALLLVTMSLTFALVGLAIVVWRLPEIERESRRQLQDDLRDATVRLELLLGTRRSRLELLAGLMRGRPAGDVQLVLERALDGTQLFQAAYLVSDRGRVQAAALAPELVERGAELVGSDLSSNALFREVQTRGGVVWSGKYLSALTGTVTVGLAYRAPEGRVLMGEIPLTRLIGALRSAAGERASALWLVDRSGEVIADTQQGRHVGRLNLYNWPLMQAVQRGRPAPAGFVFEGKRFAAVVERSRALDWHIVGSVPVGWDDPAVRRALTYVLGAFLACLLVGLVIAPFWASRMTRLLQGIVARAAQARSGQGGGASWPRGPVIEFNRLSGDLQAMAEALQQREQKSLAIFNAAPMPMAVADLDDDGKLLDVNQAWCRDLVRRREDVLGRTTLDIGLLTLHERERLMQYLREGRLTAEATLMRGDGEPMLAQLYAQTAELRAGRLLLWASVDIGPLRRVERALRELNQQLEARVARRNAALRASNQELSETLRRLRAAQAELVRAEKMAALGHLVAGVAHELHTPLGNGVMAVSALRDATRQFRRHMGDGVRKADLQALLEHLTQGLDIAERNLRRAAELVHSFKQVALDQSSAQRRSFELGEVVHEIVVSLRPSFRNTDYRVEVEVPATGLRMDSYPGPLGQVLANLLQNAVLHGFDGRAHGTVRITAERAADGWIVLRVADDGKGIPEALLARVFDPFMTTRKGRGGSGLGLHVSYNAVANLLGGTLTVHSVPGQGACFALRLPVQAPSPATRPPDPGGTTGPGALA